VNDLKQASDGLGRTATRAREQRSAAVGTVIMALCSSSCDADGLCMPLRFVWGTQKGATTTIFRLLEVDAQFCGANKQLPAERFGRVLRQTSYKETHHFDVRTNVSRALFTALYKRKQCASLCFVEATPRNLVEPLAAAQLRWMMSSVEAAAARFLVQLREPVVRHMSALQMELRNWKSSHSSAPAPMSCEEQTRLSLAEWAQLMAASNASNNLLTRDPSAEACFGDENAGAVNGSCARAAADVSEGASQVVSGCRVPALDEGWAAGTAGSWPVCW
jgi:hypothetical protein